MKTAVVIDDNRQAADTLCEMLRFLDIEAQVAYGSRDGMTVLKDLKPDIIFLDINMPGVDGFEVMAYLRRFPHFEHTPVVFVSSDDQPETAQKAHKTGALLLLIKPATIESIEAVLRKAGLY
jgi:CheY-like chemotaxis protein